MFFSSENFLSLPVLWPKWKGISIEVKWKTKYRMRLKNWKISSKFPLGGDKIHVDIVFTLTELRKWTRRGRSGG